MFAEKLERGRRTVKTNAGSAVNNGTFVYDKPLWLVLGGGALKGLVHLGAWRALRELEVPVAGIIGTSVGAVVGAGLASGRKVEDLEYVSRSLRKKDIVRLNGRAMWPFGIRQRSLFQGRATRSFIGRYLNDASWGELTCPLAVNAVDLGSGQPVWFGHLGDTSVSLGDAVYASSALPVLYPPLEVGGRVLVDGGLLNTLPISKAVEFGAASVLAVDAGAGPEGDAQAALSHGLVGLNQRMFVIMAAQRRGDEVSRDHGVPVRVIRPRLGDIDGFDFGQIDYFLQEGYRATMAALGGD